jgi:hypothetical protein
MLYSIFLELYFSKNCSAYALCIIKLNIIINYAQVNFINSEFPKICKDYTLKSCKTDSKELSLLFVEFKKMELNTFYNEKFPPKGFGCKPQKINYKKVTIKSLFFEIKITLS